MSLPSFVEAKQYLDDPHACFKLMNLNKHVALSPKYIGNVSQGVFETLDGEMSQYSDTLEGVMIAYDNVQILQNAGVIFEELPQLHFDIKFDVIVFKPTIGSLLKGVVNKLGEQHIGCLVHNCFNASISKPIDIGMSDWEGFKLALGEQFFFQVTDVSGHNGLIFIRGALSESSLSEISKGKKRKNCDESTDVTGSDTQSISKKHKRKHSHKVCDLGSESTKNIIQLDSESSRSESLSEISKGKKRKNCDESTDVTGSDTPSISKKHKRKHSHKVCDLGSESTKNIIQLDSESSRSDTPLKQNKFHEYKVIDADGFVDAVTCRASELLAGLTAQHNHVIVNSASEHGSLFSKQETTDAEVSDVVIKSDEDVITEASPQEKCVKHKKSKHSSMKSVMNAGNTLNEFHIKLEPKNEFPEDTPKKHKKHKKSRRNVNECLFSDDSMMDGCTEHGTSTVMVGVKVEVQDQALDDTPRKRKKCKKSSKDLNHSSSVSEMDVTNDSDSFGKQSVVSDVKCEPPESVSGTPHKKHKKKSKRQTETFTQHEFL